MEVQCTTCDGHIIHAFDDGEEVLPKRGGNEVCTRRGRSGAYKGGDGVGGRWGGIIVTKQPLLAVLTGSRSM